MAGGSCCELLAAVQSASVLQDDAFWLGVPRKDDGCRVRMPHHVRMSTYVDPEGFAEWEATVPPSYRRDPIWRTPAYRYALWLSDLVKRDAKLLRADPDMRNNVDQIVSAVESISANLAEGYGRSTGPERARWAILHP